jgi:hypothetical protein
MSDSLISLAKEKQAAAEERLRELQAEMERARQEAEEWQVFIERAQGLMSGSLPKQPKKITVQKGSVVAVCAVLIRDTGPRSLQELVKELREMGRGQGSDNYTSVVNSALWRRKDLFEKKSDGLYHLLTREFELAEPP